MRRTRSDTKKVETLFRPLCINMLQFVTLNFIYLFRIDLEYQMMDFVQVYDQEIGTRSSKLRDCKRALADEINTLAEWKEKYRVQEILYNRIQADREAEEEKRREEKILLFMMNRVARIIQRSYRRILAQRKAKKKGKGKKGGKSKK